MGIQNFPLTLQPIIQQGFLAREFEQAIRSRLGYRACADREAIAVGIGETLTKTRAGLKPSVTVPIPASFNTNLDNGLVPTGWGVEQYTLSINHYASTTDLNMVTSRVGIASQFLQNAYVNGEQAARSLDELARNALFSPYFGGNTRVRTTLASAAPQIAVDDVRGFQTIFVSGVQSPVGSTSSMTITVGSNTYTLVGTAVDLVNASTTPGGMSGVLTLSGDVSVQDATAGNTVQAATASVIMRPNRRTNTSALVASDVMSMDSVLDAVAALRMNAVPDIGGGLQLLSRPGQRTPAVRRPGLPASVRRPDLGQRGVPAGHGRGQRVPRGSFRADHRGLRPGAPGPCRGVRAQADHGRSGGAHRGRLCRDDGRRRCSPCGGDHPDRRGGHGHPRAA